MRDVLGPGTILGYCTNVHAGATLEQTKANLQKYALAVKARVSPNAPLGVGLWFSARSASELLAQPDGVERLRDWLTDRGLLAYTLNGFPYGDFHGPIVKHDVYQPDWSTAERVDFTCALIEILHRLLPDHQEGSISTLPIGWEGQVGEGWADALGDVIDVLAALYQDTGRVIHLDIEPEPGCEVSETRGLLTLMTVFRMYEADQEAFARHLRVCLDVCHGAVMFEPATRMLEWIRGGTCRVGKVQLSSALRAPFAGRPAAEKRAMRAALEQFDEPRYLHQTTIGTREGWALKAFHDDLPDALNAHRGSGYEWRTHFHVPVHLSRIGPLDTTQDAIVKLLHAIRPEDEIHHFEVETYAWDVLPAELRVDDLAEGIARELQWVIDNFGPRTRDPMR